MTTANILRRINQNVRDGHLSKEEAKKMAVIALQELIPADEANSQEEQPEQPAETPKDETTEKDIPMVIDPKTTLLSSLTKFEQAISAAWKTMQTELNKVMQDTAGAAFPIGSYDLNAKDNSAKLTIKPAEGKPNAVEVTYNLSRTWELEGVTPSTQVAASVESCHLGLRKDIIGLSEDVLDRTSSEIAWKKSGVPVDALAQVAALATKENDPRVVEILRDRPIKTDKDSWRKWSIAAQAYLLGNDYSEGKVFSKVLAGVKE